MAMAGDVVTTPSARRGADCAVERHNAGMARNPQRPVPEQLAILQVPIAEATAFLETQVATGKALEARELRTAADVNALEHEVQQWRDMNRSWLETRLGGPPAKEYRDVSTHYTIGGRLSPEKELEFLRMYVAGEWNKLESIKNRLVPTR